VLDRINAALVALDLQVTPSLADADLDTVVKLTVKKRRSA
jgi:hypothetical protein